MVYKIDKDSFEIKEAFIVGILDGDDGLHWAMDIYAKGKESSEGIYISPKFSFTRLAHSKKTDPGLSKVIFENASTSSHKF